MTATKKVFSVLFALFLFFPALSAAQITAPAPISDTAKLSDTTKKPVFTLHTLSMAPVYIFEMNDNAKINASHQFSGARPLPDSCYYPGERHLKNIRQLTFEGKNTRPSISPDDRYLVFQAHGEKPNSCDQIYRMPLLAGIPGSRISTGLGLAAGAAILSEDQIVYSSTQAVNGGACPDGEKRFEKGSDLYISDTNGKTIHRLTNDSAHFSGDASLSPNGGRIIFTSTRAGAPELFSMAPDGSDITQLTQEDGFDGSACYSPNGNEIVFCKSRKHPTSSEIYVMNADGSHSREITHLGSMNTSPSWTPDGEHIIFASNYLDPKSRDFDLFMIKSDGTGLERITDGGGFNGFPAVTRDGKEIVFCSSRNAAQSDDVNIFVADWIQ